MKHSTLCLPEKVPISTPAVFITTYDFEAAKAGADQSMTWVYDDYTIVMKPMYIFYKHPDSASWDRGIVVF
jgi:hypothetical protein